MKNWLGSLCCGIILNSCVNTEKAKQLEYLHEFNKIKTHTDSLLIFSDDNLSKGTFKSLIENKYLIYPC